MHTSDSTPKISNWSSFKVSKNTRIKERTGEYLYIELRNLNFNQTEATNTTTISRRWRPSELSPCTLIYISIRERRRRENARAGKGEMVNIVPIGRCEGVNSIWEQRWMTNTWKVKEGPSQLRFIGGPNHHKIGDWVPDLDRVQWCKRQKKQVDWGLRTRC